MRTRSLLVLAGTIGLSGCADTPPEASPSKVPTDDEAQIRDVLDGETRVALGRDDASWRAR